MRKCGTKKTVACSSDCFFYGGALTAEWKVLTDWSSRTEQSYRLERDRLIARDCYLDRSLNFMCYEKFI